MDQYNKFIEITVPGTACNLKCDYCYISQLNNVSLKDVAKFQHTPGHIGHALRKDRIGGTAYINICGSGETLIPKEIPAIINEFLKQGHYVNVYTNGVLTNRLEEILQLASPQDRARLSISFSFHYLELVRLNLLDRFFSNFNKMKQAGCSVIVNMVLADSYLPHIDTIMELSLKNLGALPQVSFPKKNSRGKNWLPLCADLQKTYSAGTAFDSPYMQFTKKYYNYSRKRFCYAGAWSFYLDLASGWISKCYGHRHFQNIYDDTDKPIRYSAVGNFCLSKQCGGGLFLPQGIVPSLKCPSYPSIKDRPEANWYTPRYKQFLSQQLTKANRQYSAAEKIAANIKQLSSGTWTLTTGLAKALKNKVKQCLKIFHPPYSAR